MLGNTITTQVFFFNFESGNVGAPMNSHLAIFGASDEYPNGYLWGSPMYDKCRYH